MTITIPKPQLTIASQTNSSWLIGNARLIPLSGRLLGAHIAHAGLIMFWAGTQTIAEVLRYAPEIPLPEQHFLLLPHLFTLGWGVDGDLYPLFVIGMLHLIASAVLGAGGLYHVFKGPKVLKEGGGISRWFHYEWQDGKQLTMILGHHLLLLGIAAWAFVGKAMFWGGIYDPLTTTVHPIAHPTLDPLTIFGYLIGWVDGSWHPLGMAAVSNLEDVIGGHIWLGGMLIVGGVWHIITQPFPWVYQVLTWEAEAILSYSLAGVAWMAFLSSIFVTNPIVFPATFYGVERLYLSNVQFFLGVLMLLGHIWHATRSKIILGLWKLP